MNRDALRATAHNGCVQPVRGSYGAIHVASRRRSRPTVRPSSVLFAVMLVGGVVAAYFLIAGAIAPKPSLHILSPAANAEISSGKVTVTVEVRHAELSTAAAPARGLHLHYYLDADISTSRDRPAIPTAGAWASSGRTSHEWSISSAGLHILAVQLVAGDDLPLDPPVVAAIVVQVPKPEPKPASIPQPPTPVK